VDGVTAICFDLFFRGHNSCPYGRRLAWGLGVGGLAGGIFVEKKANIVQRFL
jgi:hypothetical protein